MYINLCVCVCLRVCLCVCVHVEIFVYGNILFASCHGYTVFSNKEINLLKIIVHRKTHHPPSISSTGGCFQVATTDCTHSQSALMTASLPLNDLLSVPASGLDK